MADLTIKVCDFIHPSKSAHKYIDKESVRKAIENESFKRDLARGKILGLATHKDRYHLDDQNIPFSDNVLVSPYLANVCRKLWIDDINECLMGEFDLLDTEYGRLMRDMYRKGIYTPVSMSVQANISRDGTKYEVSQILGVDFTGSPDLEAEVINVSFSVRRGSAKAVYHFSQKQDSSTCKINFLKQDNVIKKKEKIVSKDDRKFSATIEPIPVPTDLEGDSAKTDVNAMKPVPNTNVSEDKVNVTNLNTEIIGKDVENINTDNPAFIKLMSNSGDRLYRINSKEQFSLTTKFFDSIGAKYQVFSVNNKDKEKVKNLSIDLFSDTNADINTLDIDTSNMEKIHEDIPIEDQLTEQEIIRLPNEINSQVNMSELGFSNVIERPNYFEVTLFNGNSKNLSKKLFTKKITNNFSTRHLIGKEFSDSNNRKIFVTQFNNISNRYKVLTDKGNFYELYSDRLVDIISRRFNKITNFTVQSYLQELNMQPYQVLRKRINEVIQLCRSWKQDKIHNSLENLKAYFDSYILTWVTRIINNPNEEFNIILGLRLQNFRVDKGKMRDLNKCIKRIKSQLNKTGYMDRNIQNDLNVYFNAIELDLYGYINAELAKSGKYFK